MERRSNDPVKTAVRKAKTQRRVGRGAACGDCGESRPETLVARSRPKRCYACYQVARGKKASEDHHMAGKANSRVTVDTPANDHRVLSDAQYDWPLHVAQNTDGSPLLALAAALGGIADFIEKLIVRWLRQGKQLCIDIDEWLREQNGKTWWVGSPFEGWQPG